jgi:cell division protein FtsB
MDSQFYRNLQPERLFKKIAKSAAKNKKRTLLIVLTFFFVLYLLFDNKGIVKRIQLEREHTEWQQKVRGDSAESKHLQEQIKALEGDKKTIEKTAREKYGMAREGETVYQVKKDK